MSHFQFLASNIQLNEVKNPYIEYLSVNEAVKRNIDIPYYLIDKELDENDKCIIVCDTDEHLNEISIFQDTYHSTSYAMEYSNKLYFAELQWRYSEKRVIQLIDYMKEELKRTDEIELWIMWIDEHIPAEVKTVQINDLTVDDFGFLNISKGYDRPKGLVIRR